MRSANATSMLCSPSNRRHFRLLCPQLIADMLELSRQTSKETKSAKRENNEKMKDHELQLTSLEKRLKKLDSEKDNLNARLVDLQSARSKFGPSIKLLKALLCIVEHLF